MGVLAGQTAFLIGSAIEGILYGGYIVLAGYSLMVLTWRRRSDRVDWVLLLFLIGMLLASTVHYFFGLNALVVGFIKDGNELDGPATYLASKAVGYPMDILLAINLTLSDLTMLHRLWLVWGKRWTVVVIPFLMMVTYLATLAYAVNLMAHGGRDEAATYAVVTRLGLTSYSMALVFSVTVTMLLSFPIYRHIKQITTAFPGQRHVKQYRTTILILIESGAIIALAQVMNVTVFEIQYRTGHFIWELIGLPLNQIYCLVPTLILARVGLGLSSDQQASTTAKTTGVQFSTGARSTAISLQKTGSDLENKIQVEEETFTNVETMA